jgi:hypothetical protein
VLISVKAALVFLYAALTATRAVSINKVMKAAPYKRSHKRASSVITLYSPIADVDITLVRTVHPMPLSPLYKAVTAIPLLTNLASPNAHSKP